MGTARLKSYNEIEEEGKKRINVERNMVETKKRSPVQTLNLVQSSQSLTTDRQSQSVRDNKTQQRTFFANLSSSCDEAFRQQITATGVTLRNSGLLFPFAF